MPFLLGSFRNSTSWCRTWACAESRMGGQSMGWYWGWDLNWWGTWPRTGTAGGRRCSSRTSVERNTWWMGITTGCVHVWWERCPPRCGLWGSPGSQAYSGPCQDKCEHGAWPPCCSCSIGCRRHANVTGYSWVRCLCAVLLVGTAVA